MASSSRGRVSRKAVVAGVSLCLVLASILVPVALRLPKLVEAELVLLAWWAVWVSLLTWLLYRGHDIDDDGQVRLGWGWSARVGDWVTYADPGCASIFGEGCAVAVIGVFVMLLI